jgi:hypothetical protein
MALGRGSPIKRQFGVSLRPKTQSPGRSPKLTFGSKSGRKLGKLGKTRPDRPKTGFAALPLIRKSDFAERCNVTPGRLSQWLKDGKVDKDCVIGDGQRAPIDARPAPQQLKERLAPEERFGVNGLSTNLDWLDDEPEPSALPPAAVRGVADNWSRGRRLEVCVHAVQAPALVGRSVQLGGHQAQWDIRQHPALHRVCQSYGAPLRCW